VRRSRLQRRTISDLEYPGVKRVEADRYLTKDAADWEARLSLHEGGTAEVAREPG
jgi:hypothetical protein